jgi:predicted phosphodiesterase
MSVQHGTGTSRESIVVLSDLHANGSALRAAIAEADARGWDRMVILGDLLTYGVDQDEVLERVRWLAEARGAEVILGNHDQLYLDCARGERGYYDALPGWIRESVDRTLARLDVRAFEQEIPWKTSVDAGPWLLAHANPWPYGDWRYLSTAESSREAAATLRARGRIGGVFGHTHRRGALRFAHAREATEGDAGLDGPEELGSPWTVDESGAHTVVVNPGSVGQPRHRDGRSTMLRLARDRGVARGESLALSYDVDAHVRALRAHPFTEETRERLCRFFETTTH